jgi:hypothetical protein
MAEWKTKRRDNPPAEIVAASSPSPQCQEAARAALKRRYAKAEAEASA